MCIRDSLTDYPYEQDTLEEILELLVDVVCTTKSSVRISGDVLLTLN